VNGDGFDDIVVGDGASERVDLYRGGTDWSFRATADVSVQQFYGGDILMDTTLSNAGPDTVRVRLVDVFPSAMGSPQWNCLSNGGAAAVCLHDSSTGGDIGDIDEVVTLPPGGSIVFSIGVGSPPSLPVTNTVSIVLPDWVVDPDLSNNQSTIVLGPAQEEIFADGFESGDLGAWSSKGASGLRVLPAAALDGHYGLQATVSPAHAAVVRDGTPAAEGAYHARFRFDPNGFGAHGGGMVAARRSSRTVVFSGFALASTVPRFELLLELESGKLFLVGRAARDAGTTNQTARVEIADTPHVIDVGWRRATGPAANDGLFLFQVDGSTGGSLSSLDNDAGGGIDSVALGLTIHGELPPPGPHRSVLLDAFESWRLQ
jgi:hypothetical protein